MYGVHLSTVDKSDNPTACAEEELCIKILNIDHLKCVWKQNYPQYKCSSIC